VIDPGVLVATDMKADTPVDGAKASGEQEV
jgi:hypothetical protein